MVCVKGDQDHSFCMFNLFTGGSRIVKSAPVSDLSCICYGFGYDCVDNDYKILVVWKYDSNSFDSNPVFQSKDDDLFWVYSCRDDGWSRFKGFPYATFDWGPLGLEGKPACLVNNILHWCIKTRDYKKVIATYDLHTCRFGKMVLPDGISRGILSELGAGQLCCSYFEEDKIKVWGMKEYGVKESWTMLFNFDIYYYISSAAALCEWKDGRRLVLYDPPKNGSLHWYNIDTNEFRSIGRGTWRRSKVVNGGRGTTYRIMRVGNGARTWKEVVILQR
nr:F-box protein CPR30 [Fagopyrum tataricum]